ncbi:MAG: triphosphoribosyl-dephospho-CoA synthase [Candidatus Izemoplasmatales bacterium]|jgi:holo-ACP synthase CitX|nr:triphosphoribosyl-dephospho-CoA synthase [Candidatus Izemoplasmatales bacterium]
MDIKEKILLGREERANIIKEYLKEYQTVLSIKANLVGSEKNSYLSYLLINAFSFLIRELKPGKNIYNFNDDGPYLLLLFNNDLSKDIKRLTIAYENNHELGRFVDIDVYNCNGQISRETKRKCYLCDDIAYNCIVSMKHSQTELLNFMEEKILKFYKDLITEIIDSSILAELNLQPKFGLVTPDSSGSHKDMDYDLMIKAKDAIIPYLVEVFFVSLGKTNYNTLSHELKKIGKTAETAMFEATSNINAYKGLVFNLGLMIASYSIKISLYTNDTIYEISQSLAKNILEEPKFDSSSFGDKAYQKFNLLGVKGEALSGYKNIQKGYNYLKEISAYDMFETLKYYIINVEDTSFLKRAGSLEFYKEVKFLFSKINTNDLNDIQEMTNFCIEKNLSFGGSADLLVVTVFLKKVSKISINLF